MRGCHHCRLVIGDTHGKRANFYIILLHSLKKVEPLCMIPLKETTFDFQEINEQIIGAGILPISIDDNGAVRVLLGKERYINHWRGSLKWSGFEGGRKPGESVEYTAAREFIEESMGSVYLDNVVPTIHSVMNQVLTENYVARIVLCILQGEESEKRYHVTYVMQVPYQCECTTLQKESNHK